MERPVFEGELFSIGSFHAVPGDGLWARPMQVGDRGSLLVFPKTAVRITQFGVDSVVANTTNAILYDPGREHRRDVVDPAGDHCVFIGLAPAHLAEVAARWDPDVGLDDPTGFSFPGMFAPTDPQTVLLERQIERYLASPPVDRLLVEESVCRVVERTMRAGYHLWNGAPAHTPATRLTHAELAEAAAEVLSTSFREQRTLSDLARDVLTSPFHLARVFRRRTGSSLHAYRTQLRLRSALDRPLRSGHGPDRGGARVGVQQSQPFHGRVQRGVRRRSVADPQGRPRRGSPRDAHVPGSSAPSGAVGIGDAAFRRRMEAIPHDQYPDHLHLGRVDAGRVRWRYRHGWRDAFRLRNLGDARVRFFDARRSPPASMRWSRSDPAPCAATEAEGSVWVTVMASGELARIDPATNAVEQFHVGGDPCGIGQAEATCGWPPCRARRCSGSILTAVT